MLNGKILTHLLGKQYYLHISSNGQVPRGLQAKAFVDIDDATRFLKRLNAPPSYWQRFTAQLGLELKYESHQRDALGTVAHLLVKGRFQLFEVQSQQGSSTAKNVADCTVKNSKNELVRFAPASATLRASQQPVKPFNSLQQAKNYISALGADDTQLAEITKSLGLNTGPNPAAGEGLIDLLAQALVKEEIVLFVQTPYTKPPQGKALEEVTNVPGNRVVDLAPAPAKTWVEIQLLDDQGQPVAGEAYWIICPEGQKYEGKTNAQGKAKIAGILAGTCQVAFPNIEGSGIHQCPVNVDG